MAIAVEPVRSGRDLHLFVTLPWELNRGDPSWVPPLIGDMKKFFRPGHPFLEHGEIHPYLARRDGRVVGRIASIRNRAYEEFHDDAMGFFGFFECEDDPETAAALLEPVRRDLAAMGLQSMMGPVNPSTNEECAVLVDGFDTPPMVMMTHNPPYYDALLRSAGLEKAKDLLAYYLWADRIPERLERGAALARKRLQGLEVRPLDKRNFKREIETFLDVYNQAWEKNWGFVPMSRAEVDHMAKQLKQVIDPGLVRIAEVDGQPVAFALGLPDLNMALRHADGRLFPLGLLKILWYSRRIERLRILALGLVEGYRRTGLDVVMYHEIFRYGLDHGYRAGEFSWILEDNLAMRRPLDVMGARPYKTYRLYQGPLPLGS
jgi:hypothetical protein